jgi:enoyl-CoA hydratase/carnithine racemase
MSAPSVNLAGVPSKVGGTLAAVVGWVVLVFGLAWALGAGLLLWAIFRVAAVALAVALPMAFIALGVGVTLVLVSRHLRRRGALRRREAHEEALLEWAAQRGSCTSEEAGRALGIPTLDADRILTDVAKKEPERLAMDVGDDGMVRYRPLIDEGGASRPPSSSPREFEGAGPWPRRDAYSGDVRVSDDAGRDQSFSAEDDGSYDQGEDRDATRGRRRV